MVERRTANLRWTAGDLGAFALLFVFSIWITWPLLPRLATGLSSSPDVLLNYWALQWNFHILPEEPLSYFDANIFHPREGTLAYSEHLFGVALLAWPVYLITGSGVAAYNFSLLASFVLAGAGMYLLARELTGSRIGALAAGVIFLALPYHFLHLVHVQIASYQWFPFALCALVLYLRHGEKRHVASVVVFSSLQILSCNYHAVYLVFAVALLGAALALVAPKVLWRRKLGLVIGPAIVAAVSLPFFAPYAKNRDAGFYRRYEDVVHFSARPVDYLRPSSFNRAPHFAWLPRQVQSEKALFPGFLALGLAAWGAFAGGRATRTRDDRLRRAVWLFLLALVAASFVLSLGPEWRAGGSTVAMPYKLFYRHVPGFWGMRVPARIAILAFLGTAALSAWGAAALLDRAGRRRALVSAVLLAALAFEYRTYSLGRLLPEAPAIPVVHEWLGTDAAGDGAVLVLPIHEGERIVEESRNMYFSTAHWKPLVNGFSGWWPNDYWEVVGRLRAFPTSRILAFLERRAPVRYVVIHYDAFGQPRRRHLEAAMERYRERMPARVRFGNDVVYEVLDHGESASSR